MLNKSDLVVGNIVRLRGIYSTIDIGECCFNLFNIHYITNITYPIFSKKEVTEIQCNSCKDKRRYYTKDLLDSNSMRLFNRNKLTYITI